jgi:hypothetical protein
MDGVDFSAPIHTSTSEVEDDTMVYPKEDDGKMAA